MDRDYHAPLRRMEMGGDTRDETDGSELDPRTELGELASALRAHVRRRRILGTRSTPAPAPAPSAPVAPLRDALPKPPPRAPQAFADAPKPRPAIAPALAAAAVAAERVRSRAAACADLESLRAAVSACTECSLCRTRTQTVFADGSAKLRLLFVGEAPGETEDLQGLPFVGKAGQLLTDIVTKGMGVARADVYIANVLKCRPPDNRDPTDAEKKTCTPWLDRQIELVDPQVIVALGRHAANHVLGFEGASARTMGALRGAVHERGGRKVVATFHPAYLLRSPGEKKECWKDIQVAMGVLGLVPPPRAPRS